MYLFARIIGIFVFICITFLMCYKLKYASDKKMKTILLIYLALLTIMAYFYVPASQADLSRIFDALSNHYSNMDFSSILSIALKSSTPVAELFYFVFSKIGNNHILPAFVAFVYYGIFFRILYKTKIKYNINSKNFSNAVMLFMISGQFLEVISNIRFPLAMSIIVYCIYEEIIENKKNPIYILLYMIAGFLHQAALILVLIRLLFLFFQKSKSNFVNCFKFLLIIPMLYVVYKYGYNYFLSAFNKGLNYINTEGYSYIWEYVIAIICVIYMTISMFIFRKNEDYSIKNYSKYLRIMLLIDILLIIEYSIFHRFRTFIEFMFIPFYMLLLEKINSNKFELKNYNFLTHIVKISLFVIVFSRGNMSSLKFFE